VSPEWKCLERDDGPGEANVQKRCMRQVDARKCNLHTDSRI
jgi:hypothetical protein